MTSGSFVKFFFFLLLMTIVVGGAYAGNPPKVQNTLPSVKPSVIQTLQELHASSADLVKKARSSEADATTFRIQTTLYRETLRQLMLDNQLSGEYGGRVPQALLLDMVRMSALLHSAAKCKTGRYIVCPIELIQQLTAQQKRVVVQFKQLMVHTTGDSP